MRKYIYMLYDRLGEQLIGQCWIDASDGAAIREFHDVLANPQTSPGRHPADYDLVRLAEVDVEDLAIYVTADDVSPGYASVVARGKDWLDGQKAREAADNPSPDAERGARITR